MAVIISACTSSPNIDNCPRQCPIFVKIKIFCKSGPGILTCDKLMQVSNAPCFLLSALPKFHCLSACILSMRWLWWVRQSRLCSRWWLSSFLSERSPSQSVRSNRTDVQLSAGAGHLTAETKTRSRVGVSFHWMLIAFMLLAVLSFE